MFLGLCEGGYLPWIQENQWKDMRISYNFIYFYWILLFYPLNTSDSYLTDFPIEQIF